jgi:hypothetical protein
MYGRTARRVQKGVRSSGCGVALVAMLAMGGGAPAAAQTATAEELRRHIEALERRQQEQDALLGALRKRLDEVGGEAREAREAATKAASGGAPRVSSGGERVSLTT